MTRSTSIVFGKEVLENIRDRRVIFSALFFGVLLAPVIFGLSTTMTSKRIVQTQDEPLKLSVAGGSRAPNLLAFLAENGVQTTPVELSSQQAMEAVRADKQELVLLVPENYAQKLAVGESAPLELVVDTANTQTAGSADRARRLLEGYGRQLAVLRLMVRGISPEVIQPISVHTLDVAT